ncbi:hypothetical protein AURDEDRAFT_169428 [Auricularia subglabra TFB-10046 SS5]|nr:hypothetical protein AURDEDRAFT_169428 [Auricularia subglabra TFB-10046 SS5]
MSAGPSRAKSGYVMQLNNYVQAERRTAAAVKVVYKEQPAGRGDQYTATVTLPNGEAYTGAAAVGAKAAREEAAWKALRAYGQV